MKNNDQRSSLVWLIIGLAIMFFSRRYGLGALSSPGPGFVPFLAGLAVAGLAAVVFFQQFSQPGKEAGGGLWRGKNWPAMLRVMGALVAYLLVLRTLGFLLTTFFLILFLFRVMEPLGWKKTLTGSALTALASYAVFELWLEAQLPRGILGF